MLAHGRDDVAVQEVQATQAILVRHRPVQPEREDARAQHVQHFIELGDDVVRRTADHHHVVLHRGPGVVDGLLNGLDLGLGGLTAFAVERLVGGVRSEVVLGQTTRRSLGVIARRKHPLRSREMCERTTKQNATTHFLGAFLGISDHHRLHEAEVLRPRLIALARRSLGIEIPEIGGRLELGRERDIRITPLGAVGRRIGTDQTRHPERRMRPLQGLHPGVHMAKMEMLAFVAERTGARPGFEDQINTLLQHLAVMRRVGIVRELFAARTAHPT